MKNITEKAEGLVEEKKKTAAALLEKQVCLLFWLYFMDQQ